MSTSHVGIARYYVGLGASLLTLLTGAWLILAPFALGFQPYTGDWTDATKNDFWFGIGISVIALAGTILFAMALLTTLRQAELLPAQARPRATVAAPVVASTAQHDDFEQTLASLARALADDLAARGEPDGKVRAPELGTGRKEQ